MAFYFRSIRSSSKGNCLVLGDENSRLIIDCGLGSMKNTRGLLSDHLGGPGAADAVVFTHMHSDHCSWYPLRVLSEAHLPVMLHESHLEQLRRRHCRNGLFKKLNVKTFHSSGFSIGGLRVEPFEVVHQPGFRTFGYKITFKSQNAWKKAVVVSDLNNGLELTDLFTETDFIYLESNHDLELLRLNPNPNSRFHMSNPATARLLADIRRKSKKPPQAVMLGHLSEHRNEADIALGQMHDTFIKEGLDLDFPLVPAPLYAVSETITIN